jgi:hypothetical protein
MWMEERIGKRINIERIEEALGTGPDTISTACPYCLVMLGDAISAKKSSGEASESLEIVDVATLLARSVVPAASPAGPVPATEPASPAESTSLAGPASPAEPTSAAEPASPAEPAPPAGPVPPAADG